MANEIKRQGWMFIFSAPSGGGKSSVIKRLLAELDDLVHSVSVTTRAKREGEVEGKDYYFIDEDKFKELVREKALYEYVDSDFGPKYGTPKGAVDKLLCEGKDVILDLDYPGVVQLRALAGDRIKAICFLPPSLAILRQRLINRGTDSAEVIEKRMSQAEKRVKECVHYDYVVVNDDLDAAVEEAKAIILAARAERRILCGLDDFVNQVVEKK
ncbi:MAG: guanylate kinase [Alphaproteobacteria bacterium]|nr:guanylate kinase [Alphaproteobacteria bacterium]